MLLNNGPQTALDKNVCQEEGKVFTLQWYKDDLNEKKTYSFLKKNICPTLHFIAVSWMHSETFQFTYSNS